MNKISKPPYIFFSVALVLMLSAYILFGIQAPVAAQNMDPLPERYDIPERPDMPFRHDSPHESHMDHDPDYRTKRTNEAGALIELKIDGAHTKYWVEVEWVGGDEIWHIVEGWRGYSADSSVRWFVQDTDFGKGPFRWRIFAESEGVLLATSKSFSLPSSTNTVSTVQVQVE